MAHPKGGALGRLRRVEYGGRHSDFKRRYNFGRRHCNFGGGATITQQRGTKTSEDGNDFRERYSDQRTVLYLQRAAPDPRGRHDGLRGWHNDFRGRFLMSLGGRRDYGGRPNDF